MNLWCNYKQVLHDTLDLQFAHPWADWEAKGTVLSAKVFKHDYIIKSRVVEIWNEKSSIYNNINVLSESLIFCGLSFISLILLITG